MAPRFIARQLSNPNGFIGRLIMGEMNRRNAKLNAFALRQLALSRSDRVLEIGFGGGVLLEQLIAGAAFVAGLDRSETAVATAAKRYADRVASGQADFRLGDVAQLPFPDAAFDKAVTVNTIYFWPSLPHGFAEIHRVLAPGGRFAVGFLPQEHMVRLNMPTDIFTMRTAQEVLAALSGAGFRDARVEKPEPSTQWNVALAERGWQRQLIRCRARSR